MVVDFDAIAEYGGIVNYAHGVKKAPGDINHNYIAAFLSGIPSWARTLKVQCFPLYSVLQALGLPTVDYFSLDIEGAEYQVLKTIPFKNVDIRITAMSIMLNVESINWFTIFEPHGVKAREYIETITEFILSVILKKK